MAGKITVIKLLNAVEAPAPKVSAVKQPWNGRLTFFAVGTTTSGAGSATVKIEGSLDGVNFIQLGELTGPDLAWTSPAVGADGIAIDAPWQFIRANLTAIAGTGAKVTVYMGS